jgi:Arabinose-binding domain of AraC transcription regulator, N-term
MMNEFETALILRGLRETTGRDIRPTRIAYAHVRAADLREFQPFFGCPVEFGAPSDQMEFSNETLAFGSSPKTRTYWRLCDHSATRRQEHATRL